MSSRLNMQFAHIEVLCLFLKELCGAISKTMFISELDSELYVLGAFIVFTICGICNVQKFIMKLIWFRWYAILGMDDLAVKHMLEVLACSHQPKTTQELFLRDFLQIVQVIYILLIILFNFFRHSIWLISYAPHLSRVNWVSASLSKVWEAWDIGNRKILIGKCLYVGT